MKPSRKHFKLPRAGHGVRVSTGDTWKPDRIKSDLVNTPGARQERKSAACARGQHYGCYMLKCSCECGHGAVFGARL